MNYNLKKLREEHRISQEYMARQLGVSRPTYMQIEKGEKELTVSQMKTIMGLFGTTSKKSAASVQKADHKPKLPEFKPAKFKELLLYVLEKIGAKPNIGETALHKLFYFIDFDFVEAHGRSLTGATYIKNHHGPTPKQFKKVADEMMAKKELEQIKSKYFQYDQRKYLPLRRPNLDAFTVAEIKHVDAILARLSDKNASALSEYSHGDVPWVVTADGAVIAYELVWDREPPYTEHDYMDEWAQASMNDIEASLPPLTQEEIDYYERIAKPKQ